MKAYYAHCIAIYDTKQEDRDIATLTSLGYEVVNPNSVECSEGYKEKGMDYFKQFAESCDVVVFRALPNGKIPAGIATEISYFIKLLKPVIELPSCMLSRTINVEETREYLKEIGLR